MARASGEVDRMSAYTDAVFAVVVTIMVLELKAPASADLGALLVPDGCASRSSPRRRSGRVPAAPHL